VVLLPWLAKMRTQEWEHVRLILANLDERQAELLLLPSRGLSYREVAALDLNPASVGTLISRAPQAFRKEYLKHYGQITKAKLASDWRSPRFHLASE